MFTDECGRCRHETHEHILSNPEDEEETLWQMVVCKSRARVQPSGMCRVQPVFDVVSGVGKAEAVHERPATAENQVRILFDCHLNFSAPCTDLQTQ